MNEEFVQFPPSNDEGKQPDDDFDQFLSGLTDDEKTLDLPSKMENGTAEDQSTPKNQAGAEAETQDAGAFGVSDEGEQAAVNTEWNLPVDEADQPAVESADHAVNSQEKPVSAQEPFQMDAWLAEQKQNENYHSLLILKGSKTWKYSGDLSLADIREVERIIAESRNTRAIDMARYARLGADQHKYLLYTTSISGSLILCSVNYAFRQLSEIRSQTRATAGELTLNEDEVVIPDVMETKQPGEPEPAHKPVKLETGEAAQVMLDDLLRGASRQADKDETFNEMDGWVLENSDDIPGAAQSSPVVDGEAIRGPETLSKDTQADSHGPVVIPKGGYGRANNGKPVFGKLFHLTEDQIAGKTGLNILKPGFKGIIKTDAGQSGPQIADWIKDKFADWSPAYTDLLANRTHLKNRKPAQRLKNWRPAPPVQPNSAGESFAKDVSAAGYAPVFTEKVSELPVTEAWPEFEAEEIEPVHAGEILPAAETVEPAPVVEENPEMPVETMELDQLMPPETLEGIDLEASLAAITGPADLQAEEVEEDQVFVDESSDFLKELSNGGSLDNLDQDQDATAFFEEYFNRSGELIETDEPDRTGQTGSMIEEFIPMEEATTILTDSAPSAEEEPPAPEESAPAAEEEPLPDFNFNLEDRLHLSPEPETGELELQALSDAAEEIFTRSADADETTQPEPQAEVYAEELSASEATLETIHIEDAFVNPEEIEAPFDFLTPETAEPASSESLPADEDLLGGLDLDADDGEAMEPHGAQTAPPSPESVKTFDIDQDYNQMIIAMQQRMSAFDRAVQFRTEEESEKASSHGAEKTDPEEDDFSAFAKSAVVPEAEPFADFAIKPSEPEADNLFDTPLLDDRSDLDIQAIISSALSEPGQEASNPEQTPSIDIPSEPAKEPLDLGSLFDDDVFPWEVEGDAKDILEATPTPQALTAAQTGEGLVDLLSDTNLDPVHLGFDQPMYTCILVPELSEYSLTSAISTRIREWLPRLSRVFGWQFENISIQPTYLQWTVRVPTGTSQGSIVRKVRQQLSLRIFETFPELKRFSPDGNFWAKGYLVVAGSNPPPAEFLEDFIQKNRKPADFTG